MSTSTAPETTGVGIDLLKSGNPRIDYTSLDRQSLASDLRVWAVTRFSDRWTNFQPDEFAVVYLEMLAFIGDMVFYQINTTLGEVHPSTCVRRQSFINIAKSYDYFMPGPVGSTVPVTLFSDVGAGPYPITSTAFRVRANNGTVFMPVADQVITAAEQDVEMRAGDLLDNILLAVSTGQPAQKYLITQTGITTPLLYSNVAGEGLVPTLRVYVDGAEWDRARLEADAQSTDEVYFLRTDEVERATVYFGDGINGKIPPSAAEIRFSCYLGTNRTSNVNARTIREIVTPLPGLNSVTNKVQASGGDPRLSLTRGKAALPASISTNNRAVVRGDFSNILFRNNAPGGVAKASATRGSFGKQLVWVVPSGGGPLTVTLRNEIGVYLRDSKILGLQSDVRRATDIPLYAELDIYVASDHRIDDVLARVRSALVTEVVNAVELGTGAYDFNNLGLGGRDDTGKPQISIMSVSNILKGLELSGLQKVEVRALRTVPTTKLPTQRLNTGNGGISAVQYVRPRDVPRREFRILFNSSTSYTVFRRVVGRSTTLTDNQLEDNRLDLDSMYERDGSALSVLGDIKLGPDRDGTATFAVDTAVSNGSLVQVQAGSAGSVFGSADPGAEYYLEFSDGNGVLSSPLLGTDTYASPFGDLQWVVSSGDVAFLPGDELYFDVFPTRGDVLLRPDDHPVFLRDGNGVATNLITTPKTQE